MTRNLLRKFPAGVAEKLRHYVYTLHDPRHTQNDAPFYIGKGFENDRCFSHFFEAEVAESLLSRSQKIERILSIWNDSCDVSVFIHRYDLNEREAFLVEAALIEAFPNALNEVGGHHSWRNGRTHVADLCANLGPESVEFDFPCVVVNIRNEWKWVRQVRDVPVEYEARLLSATRSAWPVDVKKYQSVTYAIAVAQDVIRQVFRIEGWQLADVDSRGRPRDIDNKKMFNGRAAEEKGYLIGKTIQKDMFRGGKQYPLRWIVGSSG